MERSIPRRAFLNGLGKAAAIDGVIEWADEATTCYPTACQTVLYEGEAPTNVSSVTCSPAVVTRASIVTCTAQGPSGSSFSNWSFTDSSGNIVAGTGTSNTWTGQVVTGGTVAVTVSSGESGGSNPPTIIAVTNRSGFAFAPVSATAEPDPFTCPSGGPILSVPSPPSSTFVENGGQTGALGTFCAITNFSFDANIVNDGGPNNGFKYVGSVSPTSSGVGSGYYYVVSPDLQNASSTFSLAQCGNYNAQTNPSGYITQANLLANTIRHESGSVASHYANYIAAMKSSDNPGTVAEQLLGSPSAESSAYVSNVQAAMQSAAATIGSMSAVEPCGCNYNSTCTFQGATNFQPYTACP